MQCWISSIGDLAVLPALPASAYAAKFPHTSLREKPIVSINHGVLSRCALIHLTSNVMDLLSTRCHRCLHMSAFAPIVSMVSKCQSSHPGEELVLYKLDLSRYYRNWRVCPGNVPFLAIRWRNKVYLDLSYFLM